MRKFLFLIILYSAFGSYSNAQDHNVTGVVSGLDGNPIPSATVQSNIGNTSTQTDENGRFKISVPGNAILTISSVGFETKTIDVKNQLSIYVTLSPKVKGLNDVVVTALGLLKKENSIGYSTTQVKGRDLVQTKPISVANGLTGKVSGMQVNTINNGVFAPTRIILRSNRSLTGNNQALIVVDGSIYYNDISNLNPEDIESINVLKGSSAAAIYGSDASNGVLLITTKKGSSGKPVILFSSTVQLESVSYMPQLQNQFGSNGGESFPQDFNDLRYYIPDENQQFGPMYNGKLVPLGRPIGDGSLLMVPYSAIPGEKRKFFQTGVTTQNNISYSTGDGKSSFFLSGQFVSTNGVMPKDYGNRSSVRLGGSRTYGIFSAAFSVAYTNKYTNVTNTGAVYNNVLNTPQHVPLTSLKDWQHNKYADPSGYFNDWADNPYFTIDEQRNKTRLNNLAGNIQLNLQPLPWLKLSYLTSVNYSNSRYDYIGGIAHYNNHSRTSDTVIYSNSDGTGLDTAFEYIKPQATGPATTQANYSTSTTNNFLYTSDFLITSNNNLSKDLNLSVTLGISYIYNQINYLAVNAGPLFVPVYNINSLTGIPGLGQYNNQAKKLGYFGDVTLGFRNFAFLHGNYRTDLDSRLSTANRYIPYYDIDAAIVLTDLIPSLKSEKLFDYLKIRAAHSLTGNASALGNGSQFIADGAYTTNPTFTTAPGFPFNGLGGFLLSTNVANANIKPEKIIENEFGLEAALLHNRLSVVAVVYDQTLKDGIVYTNTASSSGFKSSLINAAHTKNKGFELGLKGVIINTQNITWNAGVNYTHTTSKVISINGDLPFLNVGGNSYAVVGQPYPVIETSDWTRDPQGHVIVDPVTGNPSIDPNIKIQGNAVPTDLIGINTSISWKHFTLSATADYRGGYKVFNAVGSNLTFSGITSVTTETGRQRFVFPNSVIDQGGGKFVKNTNVTTDDAGYNFWGGLYLNVGSNYITSGNFWKLRELALRFDLPSKWYAGAKVFQDISLTIAGRNLLMLRPKTNIWTDPEFNDNTSNAVGTNSVNQIPPTRIFSFTLSVRF
ncbi:MAG: SusC/RagA family TonB-linked outer membrane protein [Bacteroidetes bacterium]|nr:SusC/RagA family TonB-linked outer membrane protein [Bacteroidota bacterium]